jgi:hypothetical protein
MRFQEPHKRSLDRFRAKNASGLDRKDETRASQNLAQSSIKSKLTHDPNAADRPNLVKPNRHRNSQLSKAGERVSAPQRYSLCARRTAIAQSPARPHPSRDPLTVAKTFPRRGQPNQPPRAAPRRAAPRRAASRRVAHPSRRRAPAAPLPSLLHPEFAFCRLRGHSPELRWRSLASARLRLAPSAETRRNARVPSCDDSSVVAWRFHSLFTVSPKAVTGRTVKRDHR